MKAYRLRKKWHMKLTELQADVVDALDLTEQEQNTITDLTLRIQTILVKAMPERKRGRPVDNGKRQHIVQLAKCNQTLSMSAIAQHVGCSDGLVAKVLKEHGAEISEVHREENHGLGGRRP